MFSQTELDFWLANVPTTADDGLTTQHVASPQQISGHQVQDVVRPPQSDSRDRAGELNRTAQKRFQQRRKVPLVCRGLSLCQPEVCVLPI